jgi:hypothetical protein
MTERKLQHNPTFYELNLQQAGNIYINEVENAIDSLETTVHFLDRPDTMKWKWVAISLHHSLYTFSILALISFSSYEYVVSHSYDEDEHHYYKQNEDDKWNKSRRVFKKNSPAYTIVWEEFEGEPESTKNKKQKKPQLIGFWTALARVQDPDYWMGRSVVSKPLKLSQSELESIEWMTLELRNQLTHFIPITKSFSVERIKNSCLDVLRAVESLAFECNTIVYTHNEESTHRIKKAIRSIRQHLSK